MKKFISLAFSAILVSFFAGCSSPQIAYQSKIDVNPAEQPNQYYMKVKLVKCYYDDQVEIFAAPIMLIYKNQPATIEAGELIKMKCTVTVVDDGGQTKAKADVNINNTDDGTIWQFTQTLLIQPQPGKTPTVSAVPVKAESAK